MIFSFKELKRLANLDAKTTVDNVVDAINSIGFEVEGTEKFADVEGIKFGKILKVEKNPNADKLNVCEIEFTDKKRIIQTNADNVFEGMIVVAFVPDARSGKITFDAKELKGVVSEGMLSSLNEFGIDKDLLRDGATDGIQGYEGISINEDPVELLGLNDILIEVDILTNRSDANAYLVMARELSAYFNTKVLNYEAKESNMETEIEVKKGKHKHLSFIESDANVNLSWYEKVLITKSGVKSIDDIVDLTNLTFLMTGQPVHAYDKAKVGTVFSSTHSNNKVNVLGNKEVELNKTLTITSDNKDVSIAGTIGIEETSITNETKEVIFEFGIFDTKDIRNSVKAIKMNTSASSQSSKVISLGMLESATNFITNKLNNFSNTVNPVNIEEKTIEFSEKEVNKIAGFEIANEPKYKDTIKSLETLGFEFANKKVTLPTYRHDIETQQDMNEEVLRFYGYNNLPLIKPKMESLKVLESTNIKTNLSALGFYETVTYSLIAKEENIFNPFSFDNSVVLETFVSKKREIIRDSQIHSIMEVFEHNKKRGVSNINVFSIGMINNGLKSLIVAKEVKEVNQNSFNNFKASVINLLPIGSTFEKASIDNLHPGVTAKVMLEGKMIGYISKVHPRLSKYDAFIFEMLMDDYSKTVDVQEYSQDPLKYRDVTYDIKSGESIDSLIKNINAFDKKIIDRFFKDDVWKITVRFTGTDEQIKEIG